MRGAIGRPGRTNVGPVDARQVRISGQALVEFALLLPIFLVLFAVALDAGRLFFANVTLENAAREGAFYGAANPRCDADKTGCADPRNVTYRLRQDLSGLEGSTDVTIECYDGAGILRAAIDDCTSGDVYKVMLEYPFELLTPFATAIVGNSFTLTASAHAVVFNTARTTGTITVSTSTAATSTSTTTTTTTATTTVATSATSTGCTAPTGVAFSANVTDGNAPVTVTFTGAPAVAVPPGSYRWTFGDGTEATGTLTPQHTYTQKGNYDVTLTIATGSSTQCAVTVSKNNYIKVK